MSSDVTESNVLDGWSCIMQSRSIVLVVDGDLDTAKRLTDAMKHEGHIVATAHTAKDAMRIARIVEVVGLITELTLPDGEGCDLLRDVASLYPVKSVGISGRQAGIKRRALAAGFNAFVNKPSCVGGVVEAMKQSLAAMPAQSCESQAGRLQAVIARYRMQLERMQSRFETTIGTESRPLKESYGRTLAATKELAVLASQTSFATSW
jgi:DNA-binding NtrC family response regulator